MGRSITLAWAKFYELKFQILTNCIKINIIFLKKKKKKKMKMKIITCFWKLSSFLSFFHIYWKVNCNWIRPAALSSTSYGIVSLNSSFNDCSKRCTQQRIINDISKSFTLNVALFSWNCIIANVSQTLIAD